MNEPVKKISIPAQKAKRNWAIMIALLLFVAIIYGVTIVKIHINGNAS
jgi:hypothetical protein